MRALLLPLALLAAMPAHAAVFGRNRMHLLQPRFEARLKPQTRANLARTVSIGGGSGVLVGVRGTRGLVLTNDHVVGQGGSLPVRFYSGDQLLASTRSNRVLARSEMLDYALVEIELGGLPAGLAGSPAKLSGKPPRKGEQLYKVGFPALSLLETPAYGGFDWTVADRGQHFASQPKRMVIATGHEIGGGQIRLFHDPDPRPGHRAAVPRYSFAIDDSSLPGNSGSPVFSAETHEVKGLHWAGGTSRTSKDPALRSGDRWDSANYAVPMSRIVRDLRKVLKGTKIPEDVRAEVAAILPAR